LTFPVNLFHCVLVFWPVHGVIVSFKGSFHPSLLIVFDGEVHLFHSLAYVAKIFLKWFPQI